MHGRTAQRLSQFTLLTIAVVPVLVVGTSRSVNAHAAMASAPSVERLQASGTPDAVTVGLRISIQTVGMAPANLSYSLQVRCVDANGKVVSAVGAADTASVSLAVGQPRSVGIAEFPGLSATNRCSVEAAGAEGAQITYATSQPPRADGALPAPLPGAVDDGKFRSALAPADGREVVVTYTYVGDLVVSTRITDVPTGVMATSMITVRCANTGYLTSLRMGDGQSRLLSSVPAGSVCRVSSDQPGASFEDNSDDPRDGTVTVNSTPARCWDLRTAAPDCRASVTITSAYRGEADVQSLSATTQPTTTVEQQDQQQQNAAATAAPVAAAPVEEPEQLAEEEETVG
jgi:hypothetical protein